MSKYPGYLSMKSVMRMEMAEVTAALDRSNISYADRKIVTDALKQAFYMWAMTNANFCTFEECVMNRDKELYRILLHDIIEHDGMTIRKMTETYPDDWDEDDDDEDDEEDDEE